MFLIAAPLVNLNKYIANNPKPVKIVKNESNNAINSATFSNYIGNVLIEGNEIMVLFDDISLYTNIPIIDTLKV